MIICDLIYQAKAGRRMRARKAMARRLAVGFCVATTAASFGVVTGVLIAPKSGKETRADIKNGAKQSAAAIKKAIKGKPDTK